MPGSPLDSSDLALALKRVRRDHKNGRVFVSSPAEWALIRADERAWLSRSEAQIRSGDFLATPSEIVDVPKGAGAVRSGALLRLEEQVVYTALVGKAAPAIALALGWSARHPDCSYQFGDLADTEWIKPSFHCWSDFRGRSLDEIGPSRNAVVCTDITAYYDSIALDLLASDLRAASVSTEIVDFLLPNCLSKWSLVSRRGIPQGLSASDVLAKLYLNIVDKALLEEGFAHLRYVDDIRIFCDSHAHANRALLKLAQLMRRRGLALQTAKTKIFQPTDARTYIDGVIPTLQPLARRYIVEIARAAGVDGEYMHVGEAEALLRSLPSGPPSELIQAAYRSYFIDGRAAFDKTLFHYLLGRLGNAGDNFALDHALTLLSELPQETSHVLAYAEQVASPTRYEPRLLEVLLDPDAVYPYQHYQVLRFRAALPTAPCGEFLAYARLVIRSDRSPNYLRSAARHFLGLFGSDADLDHIAETISSARGDLERAEIICALHRMERGRRNAIAGQVDGAGPMTDVATRLVREDRYARLIRS